MKISIYDLLGMIKDDKAPKKIMYENEVYHYIDEFKDYKFDDGGYYLFGDNFEKHYGITAYLNDEVEIIETTITYNGDQKCTEVTNKIAQLPMINEDELYDIRLTFNQNRRKINEIIEVINEKRNMEKY